MSKSAPPQPSIAANKVDPAEVRSQLVGKHVCPFCGVMRADPAQPCPRCTLDDTVATRSATKQRIGPWFVLQARNPSAPGMKLGTLQSLIRKGHLTPRSVVRGPTTDQMWAFAATVRGLSREFGLCFHCGETVEPTDAQCPHCGRGQLLPADTDALLETPTPATGPFAPPAPLSPPVPPSDFLSAASATRLDTGMDGGTSLDLQADHPFAIAPADPRPQRPAPLPVRPNLVQRAAAPAKEETILSARELAAAFQLDFKQPNARGSRPRRPVRTLAALLLIVIIAGGIVLGLRQDWRETSLAWVSEKWGTVAASLEKPSKGTDVNTAATASRTPTAPSISTPKPPVVREVPKPIVVQTPPSPVSTPTPAPVQTPTPAIEQPKVEPTPPPKPVEKPVDVTPPAPVVVTPPPAPTPAPTPPPVAVVVPPVPDDLTIDQATDLASSMRLKAIDAQARNDWAGAVKLYEQIQKLPRDAWPSDLSMRMEVARKRAGAQ